MPLVLGVDSSPQATTVELRDSDDGKLYGSGQVQHPPESIGAVEQDPSEWWQALVAARQEAGGALGVAAVAVAAQQPGVIILDGSGRVARPALVGFDRAAVHDADRLVETLGPEAWAAACGSVPDASSTVAKLAWLRRREPEAVAGIAAVLAPHDWLTYRLARQVVTDRGDASATSCWSPREEQWRPDLLALVDDGKDWSACLPRVLDPLEPAGDREGVMIAVGTGRPMGAALGMALEPHDVVIDLGPGGGVFSVRDRPTEDATGAVAGLADATGRYLPLVRSIDASLVIDAFCRVLNVDRSRFEQLAMTGPPGAGGLTLVPALDAHLAGRMVEHGGALTGIRGDLTPELVARAVVEGIACALLDALDALRDADVPVGGRLYLTGVGARSHAIQGALADLAARPVSVPKGDRVATGACVQGAATLLGRPPEEVAAAWRLHEAREVEPDARVDGEEIRAAYRRARELS